MYRVTLADINYREIGLGIEVANHLQEMVDYAESGKEVSSILPHPPEKYSAVKNDPKDRQPRLFRRLASPRKKVANPFIEEQEHLRREHIQMEHYKNTLFLKRKRELKETLADNGERLKQLKEKRNQSMSLNNSLSSYSQKPRRKELRSKEYLVGLKKKSLEIKRMKQEAREMTEKNNKKQQELVLFLKKKKAAKFTSKKNDEYSNYFSSIIMQRRENKQQAQMRAQSNTKISENIQTLVSQQNKKVLASSQYQETAWLEEELVDMIDSCQASSLVSHVYNLYVKKQDIWQGLPSISKTPYRCTTVERPSASILATSFSPFSRGLQKGPQLSSTPKPSRKGFEGGFDSTPSNKLTPKSIVNLFVDANIVPDLLEMKKLTQILTFMEGKFNENVGFFSLFEFKRLIGVCAVDSCGFGRWENLKTQNGASALLQSECVQEEENEKQEKTEESEHIKEIEGEEEEESLSQVSNEKKEEDKDMKSNGKYSKFSPESLEKLKKSKICCEGFLQCLETLVNTVKQDAALKESFFFSSSPNFPGSRGRSAIKSAVGAVKNHQRNKSHQSFNSEAHKSLIMEKN